MPLNVILDKGAVPAARIIAPTSVRKISGHPLAVGYTYPILKIDFKQIQTSEHPGRNGKELQFDGGTMTIKLVQDIVIANDLSPCEQRKWTAHELHHVQDNRDCMNDLEREFLAYSTSDDFFRQGVKFPVGRNIGAEVISEIEDAYRYLNKQKIGALDTQAEYQRVARDILANCPGPIVYKVQQGDTLGQIANHYYGSPSQYGKILRENFVLLNGNANLLQIGTPLVIPK